MTVETPIKQTGKRAFAVPVENRDCLAQIISYVPDHWQWIDGYLTAPSILVEAGEVAVDMSVVISRFSSIKPTYRGPFMNPGYKRADLYALLIERKLPDHIEFDHAGYMDRTQWEEAKRIAAGYLTQGYRGRLDFFRDCSDNRTFHNGMRLTCHFVEQWEGSPIECRLKGHRAHPSLVKVQWNTRYAAVTEVVSELALFTDHFARLGLSELDASIIC